MLQTLLTSPVLQLRARFDKGSKLMNEKKTYLTFLSEVTKRRCLAERKKLMKERKKLMKE